MVRMKAEDVKDNVDKVWLLLFSFVKIRDEIGAEWRVRMDDFGRKSAEAWEKFAKKLETTETRILTAIGTVSGKLTEHGKCLAGLVGAGPNARCIQPQPSWTEVSRKHKRLVIGPTTGATSTSVEVNPVIKTPRTRPLAMLAKRGKKDFPNLLKSVRQGMDTAVTGKAIARLWKCKTGGSLIEVNGDLESAVIVRAEVARSLGPGATVRKLEDTATVEIFDLDAMTTAEEVL